MTHISRSDSVPNGGGKTAPRSAVLARYLPSPDAARAPVLQARVASRQLELPFGLPQPAARHPLRTV